MHFGRSLKKTEIPVGAWLFLECGSGEKFTSVLFGEGAGARLALCGYTIASVTTNEM